MKKEEEKNHFIQEAFASIVVLIRQFHQLPDINKEEDNLHVTSCSYHLHFLVSRIEKPNDVCVMCLDNSDFTSAKAMGMDTKNIKSCIDEIIKLMVQDWNEKEMKYYDKEIELIKTLKDQAYPQNYWNKFNEIKIKAYTSNLKKYLDYVNESKTNNLQNLIKNATEKNQENRSVKLIWSKYENGFKTEATENESHYLENAT